MGFVENPEWDETKLFSWSLRSENFDLLVKRWCRIISIPRLLFAHHVHQFDP